MSKDIIGRKKEQESCGFIRQYEPFAKQKKDTLFQLTFVTTYGVKQNAYSGHVQKEVLLEDLFE